MSLSNEKDKIVNEVEEYYSLTKKVWDILAPFYDIGVIPLSKLRDKVVDFANPVRGSRVLDVATGTGKQAFAFAEKGYDVTGVDLSEAMLRVAKKNNKYSNARFQVADATKLPFEDRTFDISCISFALHDMPSTIQEKVLKEIGRVTNLEGTIVIVDYALPKNKMGRFLVYRFVRLYEAKYYEKFIKSDLKALLRKSGIKVKKEQRVLLGAGRILKGIKVGDQAN
ncbi:MAG: methyltransferase domain-containing protein [Chloroflexi bacterium]|nr:methyltransferase domain-containing protein [Chloroflexota bacterium]